MLRICAFRRPPAGLVEKSRRLLSLKLIPVNVRESNPINYHNALKIVVRKPAPTPQI
jgi:hypothetical protein